jgi:hypothetical protein
MSELKQTVTTSNNETTDETGAKVEQQTRQVDTSASADSRSVVRNGVWFLVGAIAILLAIRFTLKLFGANPSNGFVDFVYNITGILTVPFDTIFGVAKAVAGDIRAVFEPSILVAIAVYTLIGWGIVKLLSLNRTV